ncbi:MoxR family ATPase [Ruficoccus sp. ZRK36]|uniref:AAA family ATPase n=1 Tax=Ruficoccus sp. ZRK36 TaxID=2866311 RepID=UPI001C72FF5E|nr:MoxR family ATPase [Ruficoccus sp. ZRK36]QYY35100.1 MoxR family ATPase [Ruficoccus sp. ZRK36]
MSSEFNDLQSKIASAREEIAKVIIGQEDVINQCLIVIFARQHALLEGVPGVAKTLLVNTLARVLGCEFNRIQSTPDLMPTDIIGTSIYNMRDQVFEVVKGPIFTSFLLADEINRAPAKTQSALLQAMQEREVVIDRNTYALDPAFTLFATQNPVEYEGTYPLPEAQKDRFMLKINVDYPQEAQELMLARRVLEGNPPEHSLDEGQLKPVLETGELARAREAFQSVTIKEELINYCVQIIRQTRASDSILVGASPRATIALILAVRIYAAIQGRDYVVPDDIKQLAGPVLNHRLILRPEFEIEGLTIDEVIVELVNTVSVPR